LEFFFPLEYWCSRVVFTSLFQMDPVFLVRQLR